MLVKRFTGRGVIARLPSPAIHSPGALPPSQNKKLADKASFLSL
jgi:hypothetical protein